MYNYDKKYLHNKQLGQQQQLNYFWIFEFFKVKSESPHGDCQTGKTTLIATCGPPAPASKLSELKANFL